MKAYRKASSHPVSGPLQGRQPSVARPEAERAARWASLLQPGQAQPLAPLWPPAGLASLNPRTALPDEHQIQRALPLPADRRRQEPLSRAGQAQARQLQTGRLQAARGEDRQRPPESPAASGAAGRKAPRTAGRHLPVLMALMLAGTLGSAAAQDISTSLPLAGVGDRLLWSVGDRPLTLTVPVSGQVKLELHSPRLDPADSRSDSYDGDGTDDRAGVSTRFELLDAGGTVVASRDSVPGDGAWNTLFDQTLPAGRYTLKAATGGNGRNSFALRLTGSPASVSAERLAVNVHSQAFVPVLNVTTDGPGYALQLYDGDGAGEPEAQLRGPDGTVSPLTVSPQNGTVSLPLPEGAGRSTVEVRRPVGAEQSSGTVGFSLAHDNASRPVTLSGAETLGLLQVEAEVLLPATDGSVGTAPTSLPVQVGGETVAGEPFSARRLPGTYPVRAPEVPGAEVTVPGSVTVARGETAVVRVQVRPRVALTLSADRPDVCVGDVVRFSARATTPYAGDLPFDLNMEAAPGLTLRGPTGTAGTLNAARPAELSVEATATVAGDFSVTARLAPWADMRAVGVRVLPDATSLQLRRLDVADANPGDTVTVGLSLTNTGGRPQPFQLADRAETGLEPLGPTDFSGTLAPGETRDFQYRARVTGSGGSAGSLQASVTGASVNGVPCGAAQTAQGRVTITRPPPPPVRAAPAVARHSTVTLPFDAPTRARRLVVSHRFPEGADYVPGSSRLNGRLLPDPLQGASGTVYWSLPGQQSGVVSYELNHTGELPALVRPALLARYDRDREEILQGRFDPADFAGAGPLAGGQTAVPGENPGSIKVPLAGTVFRDRDRVTVVVEGPLDTVLAPTINGVPLSEKQIGTRVSDSGAGTQRLEYVGIPVRPGRNVIALGDQTLRVYYAGPTASVSFSPISVVADGSTPIRLKVLALDAAGQGSAERTLSVGSSLEPAAPDASGTDAGYQIALHDGEGELVLQPQATPTVLTLTVGVGGKVQTRRIEITPDRSRVGVGQISATVGLNGGLNLNAVSLQARASYEGPLLGGKLYVAADRDGLPTGASSSLRYPAYGDSSVQTVPLQGLDPVAVTYDHPVFHAQYRQGALPITVFGLGDNLTALSGYSKTNPSVAGFAAFIPGDLKSETLVPDGTRLLRLGAGHLVQDSDSLQLVATRHGQEIKRRPLTRYVDYILDPETGVITLTGGLERLDDALNDVLIVASYRLADPRAGRTLGYGAESRYVGQNFSVAAAVVSLDGHVTTGLRAAFDSGTVRASAVAASSGGAQLAADLSAAFGGTTATAQARYQDAGYAGLNAFSAGTTLRANLTSRLNDRLGAVLDAEYHALPAGQEQVGQGRPDTRGGSVSARADYRFQPFSAGLGVRAAFGDVNGLGVIGSVGYHRAPLDIDVTHTQPLSGNLRPVSEVSARVALGKVNLGLRDTYTWAGDNVAALTLDTALGNTNYAVSYELPTASGAGNRARFGADTSLTLNDHLTLGLRGAVLRDLSKGAGEVSAGADLRYQTGSVSASLGGDVAFRGGVVNTVLRGGVSGTLSRAWTLTSDGALDLTPGRTGARAALGSAFRDGPWNGLGYLRFSQGSLSGGQPELSAGAAAEYHTPRFALRAGLDSRTLLNDPASFTYQSSVGGTYYFNDRLGVGAWGRALIEPASGSSQIGYGLELTARALPGTWLSVGYNFAGFDGLSAQGGAYTRPGAYLRLDLTLDETLGGQK